MTSASLRLVLPRQLQAGLEVQSVYSGLTCKLTVVYDVTNVQMVLGRRRVPCAPCVVHHSHTHWHTGTCTQRYAHAERGLTLSSFSSLLGECLMCPWHSQALTLRSWAQMATHCIASMFSSTTGMSASYGPPGPRGGDCERRNGLSEPRWSHYTGDTLFPQSRNGHRDVLSCGL